ncbi:class I SAM-dependent methyltransferase [Neisseria iguanae]|uniref:Methyltransferase n=1 Tax=Neisseria iguanae TaxID=90242 RepID=A0A2P7U006_9NEIS|nr:methyltransferase domain-containing protein [Neisseria iguanae]PSJ80271.1 methyltransferase [Neisseria iguanae]
MNTWFEQTLIGQYVAQKEQQFFQRYVQISAGEKAVQIGQSWLRPSEHLIYVPDDVRMNASEMAWENQSLDMLLLPHSHEYSDSPLLALAESARVLKHGGKLVVTGFNLNSLWYGSKWFSGKLLPYRKNCFTLHRFRQCIQDFGFEIEYGQFMVYVPPLENAPALKFWHFLEKAGDRWWPQCAAVYGLVLVKRVAGVTPLPDFEAELAEQPVALTVGRVESE